MNNQKPVAKVKAGSISAAIWENQISINGRDVNVLKCTVQGRYKDKSGTWKSTGSFSKTEVPLAIHCLTKAWEKMITEENAKSEDNGVEEEIVN